MKKAPVTRLGKTFARLIYECRENWIYAVGAPVSDPALFYQGVDGATHAVVNDLEYGHLVKGTKVDYLHTYAEMRRALAGEKLSLVNMVKWLHRKTPEAVILVPENLPAGVFQSLQQAGLKLEVDAATPTQYVTGATFFAGRALKTPDEIKKLAQAQALNERGFEHVFGILKAAKIAKNKTLFWKGSVLTAEILQAEMNAFLTAQGAMEFHHGPIVSCGAASAVPHDRGHGPLKAHSFILIDSFPRHQNGYWGDLTRTVVKGKPTDWQRMVYATVLEAQALALRLIKPGVNGAEIHAAVGSFFAKAGFAVGMDSKGRPQGFFHGLGHSVGLDLHDGSPTLGGVEVTLQPGMVTSVEPGLYYPSACGLNGIKGGPGGCRIEDVVVVTESGYKNLTKLGKKNWVIE